MKRIFFGLGVLLTGCAGSPSLPTRAIDQPYALPSDTRLFSLGIGAHVLRRSSGESTETVGIPLGRIEIPISDRWTWMVLTMVRTELFRDEQDTWGLRFGFEEVGYSSSQGWLLEPGAELYYRRLLGPRLALENRVGGSHATRTWRSKFDGWHAYYDASPVFQLSDTQSVYLGARLDVLDHYSPASIERSNVLPTRGSGAIVPLRTGFQWRLGQRWDSNLEYQFRGLGYGYGNGYRSHLFALEFVHYW